MRQIIPNNNQKLTANEATKKDRRISSRKKLEIHVKKTICNIKQKLIQNHLIIIKADKDNTLVLLHADNIIKKSKTLFRKTTSKNYRKLSREINRKVFKIALTPAITY
jgi:hypothetical protein